MTYRDNGMTILSKCDLLEWKRKRIFHFMIFLSNFHSETFQFIGKFVTERERAKIDTAYVFATYLSETIHDVKENSYHESKPHHKKKNVSEIYVTSNQL